MWLECSRRHKSDFGELNQSQIMNALLDLAKGYNSNSNACISLIAQLVKNPPPMQETLVQFLGQEDPLEKG